jgi:hypothetical protein
MSVVNECRRRDGEGNRGECQEGGDPEHGEECGQFSESTEYLGAEHQVGGQTVIIIMRAGGHVSMRESSNSVKNAPKHETSTNRVF